MYAYYYGKKLLHAALADAEVIKNNYFGNPVHLLTCFAS